MKFQVRKSKGQSFKDSSVQTIEGQAMDLTELVRRFTMGQRLVVNNRPLNVYPADDSGNFIDSSVKDETFENVLPDIEDPVDIEDYVSTLQERKKSVHEERIKRKQSKEQKDENAPKEEQKDENAPKEEHYEK